MPKSTSPASSREPIPWASGDEVCQPSARAMSGASRRARRAERSFIRPLGPGALLPLVDVLLCPALLHAEIGDRGDQQRQHDQPQDLDRAVAVVGGEAEQSFDEVHDLLQCSHAAARCRTRALASAALSWAMSPVTSLSNLATSLSTLAMTSRDTASVWLVGGRSAVVAMATMSISVSLRPAGLRSTSRTDLRSGSTMTFSISESLRTITAAFVRSALSTLSLRFSISAIWRFMRRRLLTLALSLLSEATSSRCSLNCAAYSVG